MTDISSDYGSIPSRLLWAMTVLGVGILSGALIGGLANPLLLFVGVAGLVFVYLIFRNIEWGLLGLVFITYTTISEVLVDSHGLPSISKFIVILLLLLVLARWFIRGERPEGAGVALILLSAYGLVLSISLLSAVDLDRTTQGIEEYIKNAAIAIIITLILKRGDMLRHVTYSILAGGIFLGTISIFQYLTGTFDNTYWGFGLAKVQDIVGDLNSYRIGGPIGDPNFYAQLLLFVVPLALNRLLDEQNKPLRLMAACAFAVTLLTIAFTFSRGAFLGTGIVLLLMVLKHPPRPAVLAASFALGAAALVLLMPQYLERMYTLVGTMSSMGSESGNLPDSAIEGRMGEMRVALAVFADHPLLGVGLGNYEHYFQQYSLLHGLPQRGADRAAHSLYLETGAERGLVGLITYFVLLAYLVRSILKSRRIFLSAGLKSYGDLVSAYGYALLGYLVTATFLHDRCRFFWVFVGICLAFPAIAAYESNRVAGSTGKKRETDGEYLPGMQVAMPSAGGSS